MSRLIMLLAVDTRQVAGPKFKGLTRISLRSSGLRSLTKLIQRVMIDLVWMGEIQIDMRSDEDPHNA